MPAHTELVVQPFADRVLVLITQMGKVGHLIQATIPPAADLISIPLSTIQLTPIFGSAPSAHMQTLYSLYAAHIATVVWLTMGDHRPVVVGIALDKHAEEEEQHTLQSVMDALRTMLQSIQG